jgi:E3 ubiquitin-protein ligase HECTD1
MRLMDLLLVLLLEGRRAMPKASAGGAGARIPGLRRMDSAGERSHRQLIDCIRSKDTDALIDAIENGSECWQLMNIFLIFIFLPFNFGRY